MIAPESRAAGTLLGLACADALGGAVEFRHRADLDRAFPNGVREITGGGPHRLDLGEYTDDTHMALAIARAATPEGFDLDAVAANFVAWYRSGPKDIGIATSKALSLIARGTSWQEAGEQLQARSRDGVAGNGTVMRCAPVALRFPVDADLRREVSIETARMTHADLRATWGAVALNNGIAHLLSGGSVNDLVAAAVADIPESRVVHAITAAPSLERHQVRSGGYVLDTLSAAIWSLLTTDSAEEAIVRAVSLGDDADTTGAVAGALAGAHYGEEAVPARWLDVLHDRDEIRDLSLRLFAWGTANTPPSRT
jgi:ADP-ribosyl-[dinitrogen reductase] hydrolase